MPSRSRARHAIRPRIYLRAEFALGPGKIDLLKAIAALGSISAAARTMGMSYKRAWQLIDEINRGFGRPAVVASVGGARGGGAVLTPLGAQLIERYGTLEKRVNAAAAKELAALTALLRRRGKG